jgi:C4-dicarboxylate transporter
VDRRFEGMDQRFGNVDRRLEGIDSRFDGMERRFAWLVGIVVTGFVTVIGTVAGAFWSVLQVVR